jgi:quercetin dioxygenase-like cupin family protein
MWFSAKGSGMHSHSMPGATVTVTPGGGEVSWR